MTVDRRASIFILVCVFILGCTQNRGTKDLHTASGEGTGTVNASPVVNPLSVHVQDPKLLASINSLLILPPEIGQGVHGVGKDIYDLVQSNAESELGLKVYGDKWLSHEGRVLALRERFLTTADKSFLSKQGIDGVLKTHLLQFDEREGSALGGEPAAVGFAMSVIRTRDNQEVWQATYHFEQEPLTNNLFKIGERLSQGGSGTGWTTGNKTLNTGITAALRDFSNRREKQFIAASPN